MPQQLTIGAQRFELVKAQRIGSHVYRGSNSYLRIGPPAAIKRLLALHRMMEAARFPVAKILEVGEHEADLYYVEESLGDRRFSELFADDITAAGAASPEHFEQFVSVSAAFARAQWETRIPLEDHHSFRDGIHLDILRSELPSEATALETRFETARTRLVAYPYVLTHGDFNPANIYPKGVIDLEDSFYAPFGFDIASALTTIDWFPATPEYEFVGKYRFSDDQRSAYWKVMDEVFRERGLPALSEAAEELAFCRAVWLAVRMDPWPKIQGFRYDKLRQEFLNR